MRVFSKRQGRSCVLYCRGGMWDRMDWAVLLNIGKCWPAVLRDKTMWNHNGEWHSMCFAWGEL